MSIDWTTARVKPGAAGRAEPRLHWSLDETWSRERVIDLDFWFVWAGSGRMQLRDRDVELRPGTLIWMRPGGRYVTQQNPRDPMGVDFAHFDLLDKRSRPIIDAARLPAEVHLLPDVAYVQSVMSRVAALMDPNHAADARTRASVAGALLHGLAMDVATRIQPARHDPAMAVIQPIMAKMADRPEYPWSVESLAADAGYSVAHFRTLFIRASGVSPQRYLLQRRMTAARTMLAETSLTISAIAETLGYRDVYFFSRQFRQLTGQTPTQYRTTPSR